MKIGKIIYNIISAFILTALVSLVILLIGVKLLGFTPYVVLSGSMEPKFPVGSVVYVKEVQATEIEVGDAITYYMTDGEMVVTHEVIEIDDENGLYYTQGLANDTPDGTPATMDTIIGKAFLCIPYLGYISTYITSPPWIYIIVAAVLMWIVIMYMVDISKEEDEETPRERKRKPQGEKHPPQVENRSQEGQRRRRPEGERRLQEGEKRRRPEGEKRRRAEGERRPQEGERRRRPEGERRIQEGEKRRRPEGERRRPEGEKRPQEGERRCRPEGERKVRQGEPRKRRPPEIEE